MELIFRIIFLFPILIFSQPNFDKAEQLYAQEKYAQAKPIFENILKENPNNLKVLEYLGDIEGHYKKWDNAMVYYGKLKKLKPTEANYYYKYGGCLGMKAKEVNKFLALKLIGEVKESFEKAIALNPKHIDARWALIQVYIELPGIVGGSEKKAQTYANDLLLISPVDGWLAKGHIAEYFDRYIEAEKYYIKAVSISGSKTSYQKLASLYKNKLNQPQKAKETMETYNRKG
jgi:tetratricopeptide (TPR) repeat protein